MKLFSFASITLIVCIVFTGCCKAPVSDPVVLNKKILVDATKDGGGWWFPQTEAGGFNANAAHQGKNVADYLRSLGYQVDELPRGSVITSAILNRYSMVIRAGVYGTYSAREILAYDSFLARPVSLMLVSDYLRDGETDMLSDHLGLKLAGIYNGNITQFSTHPITTGVTSINYIAGSVVVNSVKNSNITVLGWLSSGTPVMGILNHQTAKIFFIGDINGIEQVPQPFVSNLVKWLF